MGGGEKIDTGIDARASVGVMQREKGQETTDVEGKRVSDV